MEFQKRGALCRDKECARALEQEVYRSNILSYAREWGDFYSLYSIFDQWGADITRDILIHLINRMDTLWKLEMIASDLNIRQSHDLKFAFRHRLFLFVHEFLQKEDIRRGVSNKLSDLKKLSSLLSGLGEELSSVREAVNRKWEAETEEALSVARNVLDLQFVYLSGSPEPSIVRRVAETMLLYSRNAVDFDMTYRVAKKVGDPLLSADIYHQWEGTAWQEAEILLRAPEENRKEITYLFLNLNSRMIELKAVLSPHTDHNLVIRATLEL